jgi:protoporphyrinogen oxidase
VHTTFDVAVLGAGISGLCAAHHCARAGLECLVLEEAATPGGCIHTVRTSDGFWFELGTHTLYNSYGSLLDILVSTELTSAIVQRQKAPFRLLVGGKVRSVASQLALVELFASAWRVFTEKKTGRSVAGYYGRLVGKRNWQHVFSPLLSAVPCQRADDFPAEMLFKRRPRRKEFPRSFTLQGGLTTLIDRLTANKRVALRTNAGARTLARAEQGYAITSADGNTTLVRNIILALPPTVAARLLAPLLPEAAAALAQVRTSAIVSTGVVFAKKDLAFPRLAGLVPIDGAFYSAVSRDVVPDDRLRALSFHFRTGLTLDERLDRIAKATGANREAFRHVSEHETSLTSPRLGHSDLVHAIDRGIAGSHVYITGNFFGGLAIEDCVLRSAAEAGRLLDENRRRE